VAEIIILGSGCGFATKDRFCTSIALLAERNLYLLDCGEPCAALLFREGIDTLALRALFISHMHPDHMGGLASLLFSLHLPGRSGTQKFRPWSVNRNDSWYRSALWFPPTADPEGGVPETRPCVQVVMPSEGVEPISTYLPAVYLSPSILPFDLSLDPVREGLTYDDGLVRVTALANTHLAGDARNVALQAEHPHTNLESYSYSVEVGGHTCVYSGDISALDEVGSLIDGAQTLIVEVAHYDPGAIGPFVRDSSLSRVVLTHIHPGLEPRLPELLRAWADPRIEIAHDGLRLPLAT